MKWIAQNKTHTQRQIVHDVLMKQTKYTLEFYITNKSLITG